MIISALFAGKTPELQRNHFANLNCSQWFVPAIILHKLNITKVHKLTGDIKTNQVVDFSQIAPFLHLTKLQQYPW